MITGNSSWNTAIAAEWKQPLYTFVIPGKSIKLCSFYPLTLAVNAGSYLPILDIPSGASQQVDELNGRSSISSMNLSGVDPSGAIRSLATDPAAIGQFGQLAMGFPGFDVTDPTAFVPIHSGIIQKIGFGADGKWTMTVQDALVNLSNQIFLNGGPPTWNQLSAAAQVSLTSSLTTDTRIITIVGYNSALTGLQTEQVPLNGTSAVLSINTYGALISVTATIGHMLATVTVQQGSGGPVLGTIPKGSTVIGGPVQMPSKPPSYLDNGEPISSNNKRFITGNPVDIALAAMQNELGVGQTFPPILVVDTGGGSGTGQAGFGINPLWTFYNGSTGLINPNKYLDITELLAMRDNDFKGDRFEFIYDSAQDGKSWIENQIWQMLGIYLITRGDGRLSPKSMKMADPNAQAVLPTISDHHIIGIPATDRWPIINIIDFTVPVDDGSSSSSDTTTITFAQQSSLDTYKATYIHEISSDGIRLGLGGFTRMFLLANRIFARHAFATPEYTITTQLRDFVLELGDQFLFTHPKVRDLKTGTIGVSNVLCEVTQRSPAYNKGQFTMKAIDTRFIQPSTGFGIGTNGVPQAVFEIASAGAGIPVWGSASGPQKGAFMFIADNTGHMSTGDIGNEIH